MTNTESRHAAFQVFRDGRIFLHGIADNAHVLPAVNVIVPDGIGALEAAGLLDLLASELRRASAEYTQMLAAAN